MAAFSRRARASSDSKRPARPVSTKIGFALTALGFLIAWRMDSTQGFHAIMNLLLLPNYTLFICDTYVNENPDAELLAEIAIMAAEEVRRFGLTPKVALLSHSNFGSADTPSPRKMRQPI